MLHAANVELTSVLSLGSCVYKLWKDMVIDHVSTLSIVGGCVHQFVWSYYIYLDYRVPTILFRVGGAWVIVDCCGWQVCYRSGCVSLLCPVENVWLSIISYVLCQLILYFPCLACQLGSSCVSLQY